MKKLHSVKMLAALTMLAAGSIHGYISDCEGPLDCGRWYIMPKIGAAPGIFANRGHEFYVNPAQAIPATCEITQLNVGSSCRSLIDATQITNVLQQNGCKGLKFGQLWNQGVVHVGFELGRNTSDNGQCFFEFFYNHAKGKEACYSINTYQASAGCSSGDCNSSCTSTTATVLNTRSRTDCMGNYTAYGAYAGHRHYFNRIWCDRFAFFTGIKFGLQHRKDICVSSTAPSYTANLQIGTAAAIPYTIAQVSGTNTLYCRSNAVSGGLQAGFNYCINDCLTLLVGVEVVATAPFKTNQNVILPLASGTTTTVGAQSPLPGYIFGQATNAIPASTGTFVQFPIWAGLAWEFDFCKSSC